MASEAARVAHVLRRLGFGPGPGDVDRWVNAGGASALIEHLLTRPTTTQTDWAWPAEQGNWEDRGRWLARLYQLWAGGANPIQERVSWILAGLLVVGQTDQVQYDDLKEHHNRLRAWPSAASYKALLFDVTNTGPMQKYLSGIFSESPHPNENLAREIMELFSIGVTHPKTGADNYTEADIKEISRALTGYRWDWESRVWWEQQYWDSTSKTFLGLNRGPAKLAEVVDALTAHNSFKYFVPKRIYRELIGFDPSMTTLDELATVWGANGDLKGLVAHIVRRPEFLADTTIGNRVKSPIELSVSALKVLGVQDLTDYSLDWSSYVMRQNVLDPPDVSGWDGAWLHPSHLVIWSQFQGWWCTADRGPEADGTSEATPLNRRNTTLRKLFAEATRETAADMALKLAGLHDVSTQTRSALDAYARKVAWGGDVWSWERACFLMQLVFNSPEFLVS